jgi:multidrug efflux pump subunit AcrA (membrane-fusion protein)
VGEAGQQALVLVLRGGQPAPVRIRIGTSDDQFTQVLSGLQPGDQVVIGGGGPAGSTGGQGTGGPAGGLFGPPRGR